MSKVTNTINHIIRNAGWAKAFAELPEDVKYKRITGVTWVSEDFLNDADNEKKLLWMIASGGDYPKVSGGDEPVRPDVNPNTPEQDEIQQDIIDQIHAGTTAITIEGTANNITIPADATKAVTINGEFQDGFTITNLSGKAVTVNNTGEAASVIIDSDNYGTCTLKGNYKDVWASVKSVSATGAHIDSVIFDSSLEGKGDLSVNADWNDPVTVTSYNTNNLNIRNASDTAVLEGLTIVAPNATVKLFGKWGEVDACVGSDTLYLDASFHATKLIVSKGNVIVYNCFPEQAADEIEVHDPFTLQANTVHNTPGKKFSLSGDAGIYVITGETEVGATFGMFASGNYEYQNNGHALANNTSAIILTRSGLNLYFKGDGIWENTKGYGIWKSSNTGELKIYGGHFIAQAHAVYAEKGFIDIYGGEFEVSDDDKRYVLNCLDANYQAGTANIRVFGGKFHDFDPANSMSEPGGPVSFVQDGYKSVQTAENIWEVFPVDQEVQEFTPAEDPSTEE